MTVVQEQVVLPPSDAQVRDELAEIAELVSAAAPELLGGGRRVPLPGPVREALVQVVAALQAGKAVTARSSRRTEFAKSVAEVSS